MVTFPYRLGKVDNHYNSFTMWRLKPLSSSIKVSSALVSKCQSVAAYPKGTSLSQKQLVRYLWNGKQNCQSTSPAAKLKTDNVFQEGQEIEGFTVTEVSTLYRYFKDICLNHAICIHATLTYNYIFLGGSYSRISFNSYSTSS